MIPSKALIEPHRAFRRGIDVIVDRPFRQQRPDLPRQIESDGQRESEDDTRR